MELTEYFLRIFPRRCQKHELIEGFTPTCSGVMSSLLRGRGVDAKWLEELLRRCETTYMIQFPLMLEPRVLEVLIGFGCVDIYSRHVDIYSDVNDLFPIEAIIQDYIRYEDRPDEKVEQIRILFKAGSPKPRMDKVWKFLLAEVKRRGEESHPPPGAAIIRGGFNPRYTLRHAFDLVRTYILDQLDPEIIEITPPKTRMIFASRNTYGVLSESEEKNDD